jgi:outer membrane protein W
MRRALPLSLLISAFIAIPAGAQSGALSATQRYFAGMALNATHMNAPRVNPDAEFGVGATFLGGVSVSDRVSAIGGLTASNMNGKDESYSLLHLDLGARYHFANPARRIVPFIDVGGARRTATRNDVILTGNDNVTHGGQVKMSGVGFTVGGGFNYFARPKVAVSVGVTRAIGEFSDLEFGGEPTPDLQVPANTTRLNVGVLWFFPKG